MQRSQRSSNNNPATKSSTIHETLASSLFVAYVYHEPCLGVAKEPLSASSWCVTRRNGRTRPLLESVTACYAQSSTACMWRQTLASSFIIEVPGLHNRRRGMADIQPKLGQRTSPVRHMDDAKPQHYEKPAHSKQYRRDTGMTLLPAKLLPSPSSGEHCATLSTLQV